MVLYVDNTKLMLLEKILKYLIENRNEYTNINKISKELDTDYKNTFKTITNNKDLITKQKIGNINLIKINPIFNPKIFSVEYKRTSQFLKENKKLELIKKDIENLNYPFLIVLLFGSYIKETKTNKSDIDICIISDNKEQLKKVISKLEILPIKLEIHDFTTNEFESMIKTKEDNIGKEIVKKNIIFYGIENYYNLILKWMKND